MGEMELFSSSLMHSAEMQHGAKPVPLGFCLMAAPHVIKNQVARRTIPYKALCGVMVAPATLSLRALYMSLSRTRFRVTSGAAGQYAIECV